MSFFHVNSWEIQPGSEEPHHEMIRTWFRYVAERRDSMFQEWLGASYWARLDGDGRETGRYVMLFEFYSAEAHAAYKERRKDFTGPYAEYRTIDPYQFFVKDSITHAFWESREEPRWLDFRDGAALGMGKVERWEIQPGREAEHDELIAQWFSFVRDRQAELFPEWQGARYFEEVDVAGEPGGRHAMLFLFESKAAAEAYYERRRNWDGPYAAYKRVDPYETFVTEGVTSEWWEPREEGLWLRFE